MVNCKQIALVLMALILFTNNVISQKTKGRIDLRLKHLAENEKFYLLDFDADEQIIDSTYSKNGQIIFNFNYIHPFMGAIQKAPETNDQIQMTIFTLFVDDQPLILEDDYINFSNIKVKNKLNAINQFSYDLIDSIKVFDSNNRYLIEEKNYDAYNAGMHKYQSNYHQATFNYAMQNPNIFSSVYVFSRLLTEFNSDTVRLFYNLLDSIYQISEWGNKIKIHLDKYFKVKVGDQSKNIIGINNKGDTLQLSDFLGKVVLLDFWSSGCGPCIMQKSYFKNIYNHKKDSGFEIISFSLDKNLKVFQSSTLDDEWTNITDFRGYFSTAIINYGISYLPTLFLIDRKGIIRAIYYGAAFGTDANKDKDQLISKLLLEKF